MNRKTLPALVMAAALIGSGFSMASAAHAADNAAPQGGDYAKQEQMIKDYETKFYPLREKLEAKRLQFRALANNPNTDPKMIGQLAEEIAALHTQMLKLRNETFGYHHGGRGFGPGMGRGGHGGMMGGHGGMMGGQGGMMGGCGGMMGGQGGWHGKGGHGNW